MATSDQTVRPLRALDPFVHPQIDDLLHQDTQFVEHFYTLLTASVKPPFAVSVDGLWGSGKTTVMKMLQNRLDARWRITSETLKRLKEAGVDTSVLQRLQPLKTQYGYHDKEEFLQILAELLGDELENYQEKILNAAKVTEPRFPTFWFDPWEYQKADDIVLAFLQHLAKAAVSRYKDLTRSGLKLLSVVGLLGVDLTLRNVDAALKVLTPELAVGQEMGLSVEYIKKIGEMVEEDWNKVYENYDDVMSTIKNEFRELVKQISEKEGHPVIIFFDDLDRCLPDTTIQLLEAVKNLFVIPNSNVIFVCGIDTHIAKQFIISHYKDIEETFAINYFRKVFNLTISMPSGSGIYAC